ncbi:cysteine desulfurase activator complex subunit SufB [Aedoeadaptatus ivorii]|uniref:Cysteine desulfurase activator complex subunit SufB n=1 Tax=Aedoeadaptatus ivorii TaxID=54006 RepID=A0A3S4ZRS8_9FIRM|nr:Fe-S cluster assembly protein SufB [Peptoniphilus ivorii]VEJ36371.1 cysteine desulfurase activator complex subunit SufB [Peptoniphilus ivorii]
MRKKSDIQEMDRGVYDEKNPFTYRKKTEQGLSEEIVREISKEKNEPEWMLEKRLEALAIFNEKQNPEWGPDLSEVDMNKVITYIRPDADLAGDWNDVPEEIRETFDKLGIPEAEKESFLSGVGAQYDSEVVYHSIQKHLSDQGVVYTDFETGLREYEDIVRAYFGKCISPSLHKYAALHYAVWSGGSFVYVPAGVDVDVPLQSYFRLNAPGAGQFEHTLIIIEEGAKCHFIEGCSAPKYNALNIHAGAVELFIKDGGTLRYSTIENWSRNMYNLNTKRAIVGKDAKIQWVSGSFGSKVSMLYPTSVLAGDGAQNEYTGISFAGAGQNIDTGAQVIHAANHTKSSIQSKSISKGGGIGTYRGLVKVTENAEDSKSTVSCESLMLDSESRQDTIPSIDINNRDVDFGHEAKIGRISDEVIFYLMTRGISEEEARATVVRGFADPIAKELPLEYAVEMNNLISLELEGSIG